MQEAEELEVLSWLKATQGRNYRHYLREHPGQLLPLVMVGLMLVVFIPLLLSVGPPVPAGQVDLTGVGIVVAMFLFAMLPFLGLLRGAAAINADPATVENLFPSPIARTTWVRANLRRAIAQTLLIALAASVLGTWSLSTIVLAPLGWDYVRVLFLLVPALLLWMSLGTTLAYASARSRWGFGGRGGALALLPVVYLLTFFLIFDTRLAISLPPFSLLAWLALDLSRFLVGLPVSPLGWAPIALTWTASAILSAAALHRRYDLPGISSNYGVANRSGLTQERSPPSGLRLRLRLFFRFRYRDLGTGWRSLAAKQLVAQLRGGMTFVLLACLVPLSLFGFLLAGGPSAALDAFTLLISLTAIMGGMASTVGGVSSGAFDRDTMRLVPLTPKELYQGLLLTPLLLFAPFAAIAGVLGVLGGSPLLAGTGVLFLLSLPLTSAGSQLALSANVSVGARGAAILGSTLGLGEGFLLLVMGLPLAVGGGTETFGLLVGLVTLANLLLAYRWYRMGVQEFDTAPPEHLRPFTTGT